MQFLEEFLSTFKSDFEENFTHFWENFTQFLWKCHVAPGLVNMADAEKSAI